MKRFVTLIALAALLFVPGQAGAEPAPIRENGLLITPVRQFISADAGSATPGSLMLANLTSKPLVVTVSVQQFSVSDYVYDYKFEAPSNDWLQLGLSSITLQPNQSKDIPYSFVIPKGGTPGGHYYTIFASANLAAQGVNTTIQAAEPVYLTVNGSLTSVSHLERSSITWLAFGHAINYNLQPINTGNVYSFVYVSGELHGLFVRPPQTSSAHILIPGKVRSLAGSIPAPVLPGVYRAVYGYKTDTGWIIQQQHIVVYIPPWFIAVLIAALLGIIRIRSRRQRRTAGGVTDGE